MRKMEKAFNALGIFCHISILTDDDLTEEGFFALNEIKEVLFDMDDRLSIFKEDSLVSRINEGCPYVELDEDSWKLFELSKYYRTLTDGSFDITAGSPLGERSYDFGGIAKGYAVDRSIRILEEYGIFEAILNFGGTAAVIGGEAVIGIRNPFLPVTLFGREGAMLDAFATACIVKGQGKQDTPSGKNEKSSEPRSIGCPKAMLA